MTIAEWLAEPNPPYHIGILLYKRHGSGTLLSLFESGENSFTRTKLRDELKKILQAKPYPVTGKKIILEINANPKEQPKQPKQPDDVLKPIIELKNISFKEMAAIHATLAKLPSDEARLGAVIKIDELDTLIDHCWYQIDFYNEHGHLPPDEDIADVKTIGDVVKLSKNVPTYISKINARLADPKMGDDDREKYQMKKAKWQVILTKIERIMNEPVQI